MVMWLHESLGLLWVDVNIQLCSYIVTWPTVWVYAAAQLLGYMVTWLALGIYAAMWLHGDFTYSMGPCSYTEVGPTLWIALVDRQLEAQVN